MAPHLPELRRLSSGVTPAGEMLFAGESVGRAIELLTRSGVAVLGLELVEQRDNGIATVKLSAYEVGAEDASWQDFVAKNNSLAAAFVASTQPAQGLRYLLTTATEGEMKRASGGASGGTAWR
jgi:hypothetical protein